MYTQILLGMEVEFGLKITRTNKDDATTSISDFQFAKDRAGPVFLSKETDATFTLTAHLKGYKKENIEINISKDGKKISVNGEKEVQEMQMIPLKKEVKIKGFRKKFKIPDGVILDRIKAKYNEEDGVLRIVMPKMEMVKGVCGVGIEEVKEEEEEKEEVVVNTSTVTTEPEQSAAEEKNEEENDDPPKKKGGAKRPWKPCPPLILGGGSTLLMSLIFLVMQYIRAKKS